MSTTDTGEFAPADEVTEYINSSSKLATYSTEQEVLDSPDHDIVDLAQPRGLLSTARLAPRNTTEATAWLKKDREKANENWHRMCLVRARTARAIPAMYPTARAAGLATPKEERITNMQDLRRGHVIFTYDATRPGTAGHIATVLGRDNQGYVICDSNDVVSGKEGACAVVRLEFFMKNWRHTFMFGASMLNGYDFSDFNEKPKPIPHGALGTDYDAAIENLQRVAARKEKKLGATHALTSALKRDIAHMIRMKDKYPLH